MARLFDGVDDELSASAAVLTSAAGPFTVSIWVKPANLTQSSCTVFRTGSSLNPRLEIQWEAFSNSISLFSLGHTGTNPATSSDIALTATHVTNGAWIGYRYLGAGAEWSKWLNGAKSIINAAITFVLGAHASATYLGSANGALFFNGAIAELAVWESLALTDQQMSDLARGVAADVVCRAGLTHYWPIRGNSSPEPNYMAAVFGSGTTFSVITGAAKTTHPKSYSPDSQLSNADPRKETKAWLLDIIHATATRRYGSLDLGQAVDLDVAGAQYERAVKNALSVEVVSELGDGTHGYDLPTTVTVQVDNVRYRSPATAIRPSMIDATRKALDPVAWWRMGEASGATLADEIGIHDVTITGALTLGASGSHGAAGDTTTAVQFPGSSGNYASAAEGSTSDFDLGASGAAFSVSLWVRLTNFSQTDKYVLDRTNRWAVLYGFVSQQYEFFSDTPHYTGDNPRTGTGITVADTEWHHLTYVYHGGNGAAAARWVGYLDGVAQFDLSKDFSLNATTTAVFFGATSGNANHWLGTMQDTALYKRALTDADVRTIYQAGVGALGIPPEADWRGTPAALRKYDRSTHEYRTVATGMIAEVVHRGGTAIVTVKSHDESLFQTAVPKRLINVDEFPSATDLGAPVPRVYGRAFVSCSYCGTDQIGQPGGDDYMVCHLVDADDDVDQVDIEAIFWDAAPQTPGLEAGTAWYAPAAVTYTSGTQFTLAGQFDYYLQPGFPIRAVTSAGIWVYSYVVTAVLDLPDTDVTIADSILSSAINTGGCVTDVRLTPTAGGTGYAVGNLLIITTGGSNGKVRVIAVSAGVVTKVRLIQPGSGYTTGSGKVTSGGAGTGCTVEITEISFGVAVASEYLVEKNRYTAGGEFCLSARFLGRNIGGAVAQVCNSSKVNPATVLRDLIVSTVFGLGQDVVEADFTAAAADYTTASLGSSVNGGLGADKQQIQAGDFIRELLSWRGGRLYFDADQDAWRITVDVEQAVTAVTLGYADGVINNVKRITALRRLPLDNAVSALELRYGPTGRVRSGADGGNVFLTGNDFRYRVRKTVTASGAGKPLALTTQWLSDYASAAKILHYKAVRMRAEDETVDLTTGQAGMRAAVGSLVALRAPHLGVSKTMRVRRKSEKLHEASLILVGYDRTQYDAAAGVFFDDDEGLLTQNDGASLVALPSPPVPGSNLLPNPDFSISPTSVVAAADTIPGWYLGATFPTEVSVYSVTDEPGCIGGRHLTITRLSGAAPALVPSVIPSGQFKVSVVSGALYFWSFYTDAADAIRVLFNFTNAAENVTEIVTAKLRALGADKNALGWTRFYAAARAYTTTPGETMTKLYMNIYFDKVRTYKFDAVQLEEAGSTTHQPTVWKRHIPPRIDPAQLSPGNLLIRAEDELDAGTQIGHVVHDITLSSGTSVTVAAGIPNALEADVTIRVITAVTGAAGLKIGYTNDDDAWGTGISSALDTATSINDFTALAPIRFPAGGDLVISSTSGAFTGGVVRATVHYRTLRAAVAA
jgi:hypothetical protein